MCNVFPARECCVLHSGLVPLSEQRYCRHQRKKEEKAYLEILKTELLRIRSWNQNEICFEHVKYQGLSRCWWARCWERTRLG
ncbi:uncharacterized protein LOC115610462 isoform X13 [Strigops habroptila]|uniref:uncharacterized protein LOC115610462 isoform X13 n=1 Tax=Strigops habroptila TaxID=2489341 RepID=UPI0011CFC413|nr:uncharacterized protein LOC115610462 isoform X13 [Strigops habroptila]